MVSKPKKSPKIGKLCLKLVKFVVFTQKIQQKKSASIVLRNFTWNWPQGKYIYAYKTKTGSEGSNADIG